MEQVSPSTSLSGIFTGSVTPVGVGAGVMHHPHRLPESADIGYSRLGVWEGGHQDVSKVRYSLVSTASLALLATQNEHFIPINLR